jgi:pimeloyl-ACP methyl ester carboxylesterase
MGGEIIIDLALENPELALSLTPVSAVPSGFELRGEPPPNLMEMIAAMQEGNLERATELQMRIWVDGPFRRSEEVDPAVRQRAAEMNRIPVAGATYFTADADPADPLQPPAIGRLGEIQVPTLVMAGALDDPEILRAADVLAYEIRGARKVILPGSAHVPNMEKPAEFNRAVLSFLGENAARR